jgi:hypothetical protein
VVIPGYTPQGKPYGAVVSANPAGGTIMPLIADFNARAADGETYRVIDAVPVPDGISPTPLDQGQQASRGGVANGLVTRAGLGRQHAVEMPVEVIATQCSR